MKKVFAALFTLGLVVGSFAPIAARVSGMFSQIQVKCPDGTWADACMGGSGSCENVGDCGDSVPGEM